MNCSYSTAQREQCTPGFLRGNSEKGDRLGELGFGGTVVLKQT